MKRKPRPPLVRRQPPREGLLQGRPLNPNVSVEARYAAALLALVDQMRREAAAAIRKLEATTTDAMDASLAAQARILTNALRDKFYAAFARQSRTLADKFTGEIDAASRGTLTASLRDLSGGITLKVPTLTPAVRDVLSATITENVNLIRSIPERYFVDLQGSVMRSIQRGDGTQGILRAVEALGQVTQRRAGLIARDQTSKATTALNAARLKALGVRKFEWLHSAGGKEPRKLHQAMSGNIYDMDDPPVIDDRTGERGLPGQLINCRCRMVPVVDFGEADPVTPVPPVAPTVGEVNEQHDRDLTAYTLAEGQRDGKEHLRIYDAATGQAFPAVTDGKKGGVTFPPWMIAELQNADRRIVLHHNHPSSSSFSPADLRVLHEFAGAKGIWAHGHNGSSYYAEAGARKMTLKTYNFTRKWVQQWVQRKVNSREIAPADANLIFFHVVTLLAEKQGYVTYRATLRGETAEAFERVKPTVDKFLEGIKV